MPEITPEAIEAILPQTQCRQCGFDGCAQYARAIASGAAPINRCAPGGQAGVRALAQATGQEPCALDADYGSELPFAVARIEAHTCIGCALCAAACPVLSITGVPKHLFAVLEDDCTGCGLCVCACPVGCIAMHEVPRSWTRTDADRARAQYAAAQAVRARARAQRTAHIDQASARKADVLAAVLGRARHTQ